MNQSSKIVFLLICISALWNTVHGQDSIASAANKTTFIVLPAPFRYPETRFGVVVGGLLTYRLNSSDSLDRPSQLQAGGGYTQNKQILSYINSQIVTSGQRYLINTEFGYYRYFFPFGGIGFSEGKDYNENYSVLFPRVRATVLKRWSQNFYAGMRLFYDNYKLYNLAENGLLAEGKITGSAGGMLFQSGLVGVYDSRDNIFSPYQGSLIELSVTGGNKSVLGDYNFSRWFLSASKYFPLGKKVTLAGNAIADIYNGNPPFNNLAYLGGAKNLRGFYEGRYRNKKALSAQGEIRLRVLPWLGFVAFTGTGTVAETIDAFRIDQLLVTAGTGIRFTINKKDRVNLRIDYGQTNKGYGNFYLTFAEAF